MCYVCCKEFRGWCRSFTRTEGLLSILEAILLAVFFSFLVFLILHFLVCRTRSDTAPDDLFKKTSIKPAIIVTNVTTTSTTTLSPDIECTWEPSHKTSAPTHYYVSDRHTSTGTPPSTPPPHTAHRVTSTDTLEIFGSTVEPSHEYDDVEFLEQSDGEDADDRYKSQIVALVKQKPPEDVTFGCILTKITKFWLLTAASCIEAIEEVDSLDSFIIVEEWGSGEARRPRAVADVRLHPRYAGRRRAHDLAALRSDRALLERAPPLRLPRLLDYFLVAVGERFHILGYGGYRSVGERGAARRLRQAAVFVVARAQCGAEAARELWAPRHLERGGAARHGACGAAALCAGARFSRGTPCNYCAGAPLLRAGTLFGVMSDNSACGISCEPQLYVNIATVRDWIDSLTD